MVSNKYSSELYHHGIKGMKWGVRKDESGIKNTIVGGQGGSAKGTERLAAGAGHTLSLSKRKKSNWADKLVKDHNEQIQFEKSHRHKEIFKQSKSMSDDELKTKIQRMNLERQYRQLMEDELKAGRTYLENKIVNFGDKTIDSVAKIGTGKITKAVNERI